MLDRGISTNFLPHRLSLHSSHPNFPKKNCLAKNGGHLEFSNFLQKIAKHKNACISKIVLDRAISTKFLTHRVSLQSHYASFYPTALNGCWGIVFTHGVRMGGRASCPAGGWAGGRREKVCPGLYLRNRTETGTFVRGV